MIDSYSFKLSANKWVIKARWFYVTFLAAVYAAFNFPNLLLFNWENFDLNNLPVVFVLLLALLINALLYMVSRMIDLETAHRHVPILSFLQIVAEIALISFLLYDLPAAAGVIPILFFIPIVESIVLFGHFGPLLVSILIGVILNVLVFFANSTPFNFLLVNNRSDDVNTATIFTWSLIFSALYLIIGLVSSYVAGQIRKRETELIRETEEKEVQMNSLRNFNRELERDTHELEAKDFELEMANRRLEKLEEAKSKFVSVTAHQLRTPLSAIKWTMEMLQSGQLGPVTSEQKEFISKGFESTQRMIRIVNDLLQVDHMEAEKIEYHFSKIDILALVNEVAFEFANQVEVKKIKLEIEKPKKSLPQLEADPVRLRLVLENLLDNAIKYTASGGQIKVSVSDAKLNISKPLLEIVVSDSGIGIPEEEKSKIFSKFFRAENAVRAEPDGSGVGLYLSKDIVEKHGGSIWYEKGKAGGTDFHLTLPLKQAS